jgi:hypothetical protein
LAGKKWPHQRSLKNLLISLVEQFAFGFRIRIAPLMVVLIGGLAFSSR